MANRPIFYISDKGYVLKRNVEFEWFPGFSLSQTRKSIRSLHENAGCNVLEVSTKGENLLGVKLSAFSLKLGGIPLECIFQSSKVFENGGPYRDIMNVSPKEAKHDERLKNSGRLIAFEYDGVRWPLVPTSAFYDYIYCKAVRQNFKVEEINEILNYDGFTDIMFNPLKSLNTQARAIAICKLLLMKFGEFPEVSKEDFIKFHKKYVSA